MVEHFVKSFMTVLMCQCEGVDADAVLLPAAAVLLSPSSQSAGGQRSAADN